jgi:hypothetical protein
MNGPLMLISINTILPGILEVTTNMFYEHYKITLKLHVRTNLHVYSHYQFNSLEEFVYSLKNASHFLFSWLLSILTRLTMAVRSCIRYIWDS